MYSALAGACEYIIKEQEAKNNGAISTYSHWECRKEVKKIDNKGEKIAYIIGVIIGLTLVVVKLLAYWKIAFPIG